MEVITKTEDVLPPFVEGVQEDFKWAADTLDKVAGFLYALEEQIHFDMSARTCCHGIAEALQGFIGRLRKESDDFAAHILPESAPEPGVVVPLRAKEGA